MSEKLPETVRYVKNGPSGRWWSVARTRAEIHAGWDDVSHELLMAGDQRAIERRVREAYGAGGAGTREFNALTTLLDQPSRHLWVTFEEGCLWWCTAQDGVQVVWDGPGEKHGHFWLSCDRPWQKTSLKGRPLEIANLPGIVTTTQGFRATVCQPEGWQEILRLIHDLEDVDAAAATEAKRAYEQAVLKLVNRLREKDFELLVDLILSRSGWSRLAKLGGATEGVDIEAENVAINEIAFVQVKSTAGQAVLNDYVNRFNERLDRYSRMIFAVHKPNVNLAAPANSPIQIWTGERIASLAVKHGLGDWVASRV